MYNIKQFIYLSLFLIQFGCDSNKSNNVSNNDLKYSKIDTDSSAQILTIDKDDLPFETLDSLKEKAIINGDESAYIILKKHYFLNDRSFDEHLYFHMIMANKHNISSAYREVYGILSFNKDKGYWDETTKNIAFYYLLKAYETGNDKYIKKMLLDSFKVESRIPKSKKYLQCI
jgi:hypothetical protein